MQFALWLVTKQAAVGLHGLETTQGLTQFPELQASFEEHSGSEVHPTSIGATDCKEENFISLKVLTFKTVFCKLTDSVTAFISLASKTWQACA